MSAAARGFRAWRTVFSVFMQDALAYRSQALIWMLTDTVPAVLMPLVWLASYHGRATIGGFTPSGMIAYYLVMLCLTSLMISHAMWDIATEVREGRFSVYLTRPFSYMAFHYAGNLSWRLMRALMFIPMLAGCFLIFRSHLRWEGYSLHWTFWLAILGGHFLSFLIGYGLGMLALFFTEVRSIFLFYYMPLSFLSGEIVPLSMLPGWARELARVLPFRYTLAFPAEIFMNRLSPAEVGTGFLYLGCWLAAAYLAAQLLWRRGLRAYTGVGM